MKRCFPNFLQEEWEDKDLHLIWEGVVVDFMVFKDLMILVILIKGISPNSKWSPFLLIQMF